MLKLLTIKNYLLIDDLEIEFDKGLSIITGETGAGKSILLGALALLSGKRADTQVLMDRERKCIVEGTFVLSEEKLKDYFSINDLDFEEYTTVRREISSSGKSRAFINDTPVNLSQLKELGAQIIDIHSQHENLLLSNPGFQLRVVDAVAKTTDLLQEYKGKYLNWKTMLKNYEKLKLKIEKEKSDLDYFQYQFDQLESANLKENEQEELEAKQVLLDNAETIKSGSTEINEALTGQEGNGVLDTIRWIKSSIAKLSDIYPGVEGLKDRMESVYIEMDDIVNELDSAGDEIEYDPEKLEYIQERLGLIYSLQQKHNVGDIASLIDLRNELNDKIASITIADETLERVKKEIDSAFSDVQNIGNELSIKRKSTFGKLEKKILEIIQQLGMPNADFELKHKLLDEPGSMGFDSVEFYFSANKNMKKEELGKVASGGEMSRLMLAIRSVLAGESAVPTLILDEIDTGISGEIARKMGYLMKDLSQHLQIISITHLPQVAGLGQQHYKVVKKETKDKTITEIISLVDSERVNEIAAMLSGEKLTEAALENAQELLN
ncbi:MAG: DNA repair protein RecN [Marinilabiliales bacterium]|nr:MAG: DNA repair protein RecN [Marinilabiliales bacterium]